MAAFQPLLQVLCQQEQGGTVEGGCQEDSAAAFPLHCTSWRASLVQVHKEKTEGRCLQVCSACGGRRLKRQPMYRQQQPQLQQQQQQQQRKKKRGVLRSPNSTFLGQDPR
mmetsp:Transcript_86212/g.180371  ORF Transcript_86212/g.180371 Transcript_86212/m.180371 type:complete len:110 (+) Transcript_86212:1709-2038(+)